MKKKNIQEGISYKNKSSVCVLAQKKCININYCIHYIVIDRDSLLAQGHQATAFASPA